MAVNIIARFIGQDGSLGFRTGRKYIITIEQGGSHNWIWVKEISGKSCPYASVDALERNWDIDLKNYYVLNNFRF